MTTRLAPGDPAPSFSLQDADGARVSLEDYRGRNVVVYFYPKAATPGCTTEACDFRDRHAAFAKKKVVVLGVSPDSVRTHQGFKQKHALPFPLVADPDKKIANLYGVFQEKTMYGKKVLGIVRTTFVIDPQGKVSRIYPKVKVAGHIEAVLAAV